MFDYRQRHFEVSSSCPATRDALYAYGAAGLGLGYRLEAHPWCYRNRLRHVSLTLRLCGGPRGATGRIDCAKRCLSNLAKDGGLGICEM